MTVKPHRAPVVREFSSPKKASASKVSRSTSAKPSSSATTFVASIRAAPFRYSNSTMETTITENAGIAAYLEAFAPDPPLLGVSAEEKGLVANWNARAELEGLWALADALRNRSKGMVGRAITGPTDYPQIPELAERGLARANEFFEMLNERLGESEFVAGDRFSVADITAYVCTDFAAWVKSGPTDTQREHEALARPGRSTSEYLLVASHAHRPSSTATTSRLPYANDHGSRSREKDMTAPGIDPRDASAASTRPKRCVLAIRSCVGRRLRPTESSLRSHFAGPIGTAQTEIENPHVEPRLTAAERMQAVDASVLVAIVLRDPEPTVLVTQRHHGISYPGIGSFPEVERTPAIPIRSRRPSGKPTKRLGSIQAVSKCWGRLGDYYSHSGFRIAPTVAPRAPALRAHGPAG